MLLSESKVNQVINDFFLSETVKEDLENYSLDEIYIRQLLNERVYDELSVLDGDVENIFALQKRRKLKLNLEQNKKPINYFNLEF